MLRGIALSEGPGAGRAGVLHGARERARRGRGCVCEGQDVLGRDRNVGVVRQAGVERRSQQHAGEHGAIRDHPARTGCRARAYTRATMGRRAGVGRRAAVLDTHRLPMHARRGASGVLHGSAGVHAQQPVVHGTRMQRHRLRYEGGIPGHDQYGQDALWPAAVHEGRS